MQEDYEFEWDEAKNIANKNKHGFSLSDARMIWDDQMFLEVHLTSEPEDRWAAIGRISKSSFWTAIFTYRNNKIRLISARKSTKKEEEFYGEN